MPESTSVFMTIPMGLMSIADYLDRHGFKVKIMNLCEMMLSDPEFNVERFLKRADAAIFGIDLHWCIHSQGAIEIARLCKKQHPNSLVVLGGLTATRFASEIVEKFRFVDAVVRGEAERPMLRLAETAETGRLHETPNLTYQEKGRVHINNDMSVVKNLDMFDFTRFDLLEPRDRVTALRTPLGPWKHWSIPVCRGCL
ncbi:MAG: cobalamin-dependent protein, partial [Candidatus Bathyarchaeota archaeon]